MSGDRVFCTGDQHDHDERHRGSTSLISDRHDSVEFLGTATVLREFSAREYQMDTIQNFRLS